MSRNRKPHRGNLAQPWDTQCECQVTVNGQLCACTDWFTIPAGKPHPNVPCCPGCLAGKHK
jgi:hypothetical protein